MEALTRSLDGTQRKQALLWTMTKGRNKRARCALWSHPLGWELRLTVNGELVRSQAYRLEDALLRNLADWRDQFAAKGWEIAW
jgi:hypothetical protein